MYLYFAPEWRETSQRCRAVENRCVFSARVKVFYGSSGARSAGGRLFQVVGPLMAKLRCSIAVGTHVNQFGIDWTQSASSPEQTWSWQVYRDR